MAIWIKGGTVALDAAEGRQLDRGDVLIVGDRIAAIGADLSEAAAAHPGIEVIEAHNRLVLPGFVDAHMHSNEGFEMGLYDNLPLELWLNEVYPPFVAREIAARDWYLRAMLIGIVSVRSGVTTLQDDVINLKGTTTALDETASAYRDLGLRAWMTASMWDRPLTEALPYLEQITKPELLAKLNALPVVDRRQQIDLFHHQYGRWHGAADGRLRIILGPCGPQRCTTELLEDVAGLSASLDLPIHCHVLETKTQAVTGEVLYGSTLVRYLHDIGTLTHRFTLNHAIWLSRDDIDLMGAAGCSITHNPLANLKLGSGVAPVRMLMNAGVNVALGCDGVASADTADIFAAIKTAAMLHKIGTHDYREWISAREVYRMATLNGARSSLMDHEVSSLEVGKKADIILLDRHHYGFLPLHDIAGQIAFSAQSECVDTSIINGTVVMRGRKLTLIDEDAVRAEIAESAERFRRDLVPLMREGAKVLRPTLDRLYARATAETVPAGHIPLRMPPAHAVAFNTQRDAAE